MSDQDPFEADELPPLPGLGDGNSDGLGGSAGGPNGQASSDSEDAEPAISYPDADDSLTNSRPNITPDLIGGLSDMGRPAVQAFGDAGADDAEAPPAAGNFPPLESIPAASDSQAAASMQEPAAAKVDPFIGKEFVGYTIMEPLGQGGMGMVYKANQVRLDRMVAIKMLNKALVDNDEFIKRFQREARSMAQLHHPHIVSVIDFGEHDGIWYMVVEFVDGTNLSKMIREQLMVPAQDVLPVVIQCLSGLDYVARSGVVHRDIKPDNILIDKEKVAKLADFGLAKDFSKEEETDLTAAGSAMGTPSYMSPEQCMGRPLDVRSDIYALGVTAYYALTGEKPFVGQSSFEIMMKQREHIPPAPNKINPQIPSEIADLVMRMIEKDPSARFETAEAAREAWTTVGQELGLLSNITRSGEYYFVDPGKEDGVGSSPANTNLAEPLPLDLGGPLASAPAEAPMPAVAPAVPESPSLNYPGADLPPVPDIAAVKPEGGLSEQAVNDLLGDAAVTEKKVPSDVHVKASSARHTSRKDTRRTGANRANMSSRLVAADGIRQSEADRLFRGGDFKASAEMYARLAEVTDDRRQRTLLRTKEREARGRIESQEAGEIEKRLSRLLDKGQLKEAQDLLDRMRQDTSSTTIDRYLGEEAVRIRKMLQSRKRKKRFAIVAIILLALAVGVVFFQDQIKEFISVVNGDVQRSNAEAGE